MKKTILTILLALLLLIPVFAETVIASKNIDVFLELGMTPNYQFGVTNSKVGDTATELTSTTRDIQLSVDKDNLKLLPQTSVYFSYIFTEYEENVTLKVSTNGDLINSDEAVKDVEANKKKIPYVLFVSDEKKLNSSTDANSSLELFKTDKAATKIDERVRGSIAFEIRPVEGSDSIKDKAKGTYKSTLTLTVESV